MFVNRGSSASDRNFHHHLGPQQLPAKTENEEVKTRANPGARRKTRSRPQRSQTPSDREQYLAKNRAAANKSRKKKKEWIQGLESDLEKKRTRNNSLKAAVDFLRRERAAIKAMCLQHLDCDCSDIRAYMRSSLDSHLENQLQTAKLNPESPSAFELLGPEQYMSHDYRTSSQAREPASTLSVISPDMRVQSDFCSV